MSSIRVLAFRDAEKRYNDGIRAWNAMTPEQRKEVSPTTDRGTVEQAARELIDDACDRHRIEERSTVYLRLSSKGVDHAGWAIDHPTFDGYPLEGYDNGALNEACEHDGDGLRDECDALRDAAMYIELPTATKLSTLLNAGFEGLASA